MRAFRAIAIVAVAAVAAIALDAPALAQSRATPPNWGYEIVGGKRVARSPNRVTKPDGSWREEIRQGKCVTIKERSATGEYKETRQCDGSGKGAPSA